MSNRGFAFLAVVLMMAVLATLLTAYFTISVLDTNNSAAQSSRTKGFFAAESALNLRAAAVKEQFANYSRPSGTAPGASNPCSSGNMGSGDFACQTTTVQGKQVVTYMRELTNNVVNGDTISIPPGEPFQGLWANQYRYDVFARALNRQNQPEAIVRMTFRQRLIPLFQFGVFYEGDLEFDRTATMTMDGPIHSNANIFLDAGGSASLTVTDNVTAVRDIYRGGKSNVGCNGTVSVLSVEINCGGGARRTLTNAELSNATWAGRVQNNMNPLQIPAPSAFDPGGLYWERAELRVVLNLNTALPQVEVRNVDGSVNVALTTLLNTGTAFDPNTGGGTRPVDYSNSFYNNRELTTRPNLGPIHMLEVNMAALLQALQTSDLVNLADTTDNGLVFYFGVVGPNSSGLNNYGVRIRNGADLTIANPQIKGLTVVTNQALYVQGDYNSDLSTSASSRWRPAALLSDSINILSNEWFNQHPNPYISGHYGPAFVNPTGFTNNIPNACGTVALNGAVVDPTATQIGGDAKSNPRCRNRWMPLGTSEDSSNAPNRWIPPASNTIVQAAVLTGSTITPTIGGQSAGGVHNIMRFHEQWTNQWPEVRIAPLSAAIWSVLKGAFFGTVNLSINGVNLSMRRFNNITASRTFTYRGSIVSLTTNGPQHVNGNFFLGQPWYHPPIRNWAFDTRFRNFTLLPPLTPMASYMSQELFHRDYNQ
ncbi:hypothetical protein [Meiothermus sp.]|uniref:hypothetical protein n=1 Tax=Meiothermus sp. TaxID=1955249 RepID=UPI0026330350|nr:hypothetical protein [Meiothermus sp.]